MGEPFCQIDGLKAWAEPASCADSSWKVSPKSKRMWPSLYLQKAFSAVMAVTSHSNIESVALTKLSIVPCGTKAAPNIDLKQSDPWPKPTSD